MLSRLVWLCLTVSLLHAEIDDHLKPASNKPESLQGQVRNIDYIYVINLDQRPEKFQLCLEQLNPYGISPYRFSAVNGWELSLEAINDLGVRYDSLTMTSDIWGTRYLLGGDGKPHHEIIQIPGEVYFSHCMSKGAIGIVLSHLSVLKDAYESGYETIWVMEDDIAVIQNPHLLSGLIDQLDALVGKNGWDILFTDQDTKNGDGNYVPCQAYAKRPNFIPSNPQKFINRKEIDGVFRSIGARYGAYSMIVRRSGMKKLLDFFRYYQIFLPFDMDFTQPKDIRFYTVIQDVVSTLPKALSDNGAPNYKSRE
jgi:GR25 family glycosyltransferase involved in LPS biosynthesis